MLPIKLWGLLLLVAACALSCGGGGGERVGRLRSKLSVPTVVVRQVYGGGGTSTPAYHSDFIELFNSGDGPTSLDYLQVVWNAGNDGTYWGSNPQYVSLPRGIVLAPGQSYLIAGASSAAGQGTPLPTPDLQTSMQINESAGRVMIVYGSGDDAQYVQIVAYGAATFYFGSGPAAAPSATTAVLCRANGYGCDSSDSSVGYVVGPPEPRNMAAGERTIACTGTIDDGNSCSLDICVPRGVVNHYLCSALDRSVSSNLADSASFLFAGINNNEPSQIGVDPTTIGAATMAVVRGRLVDKSTPPNPISGVTVSVVDHPEFALFVGSGGRVSSRIAA